MTRALARELASRTRRVRGTRQGGGGRDRRCRGPEGQQKALCGRSPLGHLGKPRDIASAVAFVASPQAAYITGQEIHVNGGMYMQ